MLGKSKSLIDLERKLNDSRLRVPNLDFNEDCEVDYLRVMEIKENIGNNHSLHLIVIQALFDQYDAQDVAGYYPTSYRAWPRISVFEYKSIASAIIQANKGAFDKYKMANHRMSQRAAMLYRDISFSAYEKRYPYNRYKKK